MSKNREIPSEVKNRLFNEREEIVKEGNRYVFQKRLFRFEVFFYYGRILAALTLAALIVYSVAFSLSGKQEIVSVYGIFEIPYWVILAFVGAVYIGSAAFEGVIFRRNVRKASRAICLYASVSAAELLEQDKIVEAGFFTNLLFSTIKEFAESVRVEIGPWKPSLRKVFLGAIEKAWQQREAISRAMVDMKDLRNQFSYHLYLLASHLFSLKSKSDFNKAHESLQFIMQGSRKYWVEPTGFLQRHKRVAGVLVVVHGSLKLTLVPILLFILWLIFGYK